MNKLFVISILLLAIHCSQPKQQNAPPVVTDEALLEKRLDAAEKYQLDTIQSIVTWIGSKPAGQHNGIIKLEDGFIAMDSSGIFYADITVDVSSLEVKDLPRGSEDIEKLTNHLRSEDFFETDSFPHARFQLASVAPYDTSYAIRDKEEFKSKYTPSKASEYMVKSPTHVLKGNLTMKGITKNIEFPIYIQQTDGQLRAEARFNIDRTDWNVSYGAESDLIDRVRDQFIYNTVNLGFSIIANKK